MSRCFVLPVLWFLISPLASGQPGMSAQGIPDDTMITLQRGNCESGCPEYRIVIFANGDVIWQGLSRVARTGLVASRIERNAVRKLLAEFEALDYFRLRNVYGFRGSGCPPTDVGKSMVTTSLSSGGRSQTISHYSGCAGGVGDKLTALEHSIDETAVTRRWISGAGSK